MEIVLTEKDLLSLADLIELDLLRILEEKRKENEKKKTKKQ